MVVPQMIKSRVTVWPSNLIPHLGIYPREMKTYVHRKICTWMFIATLFIITQRWKQPQCPSIDEWINKMLCIHTVECCLAIKRKYCYIPWHGCTLQTLHIIWFHLLWNVQHRQIYLTESRSVSGFFFLFLKNWYLWSHWLFFLAVPRGLQNLSSPTRDWTWGPGSESA